MSLPAQWPQSDGTAISCREKLRVLSDNHAELAQMLRDAFDDAMLMGVDESAMRQILRNMIDELQSPRRMMGQPAAQR